MRGLEGIHSGRKPKPKAVCGPKSGCIRVLTTKTEFWYCTRIATREWHTSNLHFRLTISAANSHPKNVSSCAPATVVRTHMQSLIHIPDLLPRAANALSALSPRPCTSAKRRCLIPTVSLIGKTVISNTPKPHARTQLAPMPSFLAQRPTSSIPHSVASSSPLSARLKQIRKFRPFADILFGVLLRPPLPKSFVHLPRYYPVSNNILHTK